MGWVSWAPKGVIHFALHIFDLTFPPIFCKWFVTNVCIEYVHGIDETFLSFFFSFYFDDDDNDNNDNDIFRFVYFILLSKLEVY